MPNIRSYQSTTNASKEEQQTLLGAPSSQILNKITTFQRIQRIGSIHSSVVLLTALCGAIVMLVVPLLPSSQETQVLQENNYPLLGTSLRKLRRMQSLANTAKYAFLGDERTYRKVLRKIGSKHRSKDLPPPLEGCEATILLLRHCEKASVREHCAYQGYERSVYLATLFGNTEQERWPAPSYIFAMKPTTKSGHKMNFREVETVGPTAEKHNITIDTSFRDFNSNELASMLLTLLQTGEMCGKLVLVAWKHSDIGHLSRHLGCGPMQGCPMDYRGKTFDQVWQIKYTYKKPSHSTHKDLEIDDKASWQIFGTVQNEGFDPLAFSKKLGDYPPGGTSHGARWKSAALDIPERQKHGRHRQDVWPKESYGIVDQATYEHHHK